MKARTCYECGTNIEWNRQGSLCDECRRWTEALRKSAWKIDGEMDLRDDYIPEPRQKELFT